MIQITCQQCGLRILVPGTVQGKRGVCFGCGAPLTVPPAPDPAKIENLNFEPGERVSDRYIIKRPIGRGGMGVVYHASDELIGEDVALKFMRPRLLSTLKGRKRFIHEAQIVRRLRHERIIAVHDVSSTNEGIMFLSMELLSGRSLRDLIRKQRKNRKLVGVRLAVSLIGQVLQALDYAHRTVIHRDIKPENVMILPGEKVKVLDFGLAQAVDEDALAIQPDPAKPERVIGTLAYASPEQHRHLTVDHRTDIYSAGLVLRELFTLLTPMDEGANVNEMRNDVSPSIITVLDKALNTDRELRWQTAREFRKALTAAYQDSYREIVILNTEQPTDKIVSTENMIYLEGGSFLMGNNDVPEEAPQFEISLKPFYIDKYPVTVEEYTLFIEETGHAEPKFWNDPEFNGPLQPVVGITLNDAATYAAWAGKQLPTEYQWEFAARGRDNRRYPWGPLEPDPTRCNIADYLGMPSIVTMHEEGKTPEGIFDMAGNIYEWTVDAFEAYGPKEKQKQKYTAPRRVVRGGSWHSPSQEARTSHRKGLFPEAQLTTVGLRCVLPAARAPKT